MSNRVLVPFIDTINILLETVCIIQKDYDTKQKSYKTHDQIHFFQKMYLKKKQYL